ncbi:D-amino-acid transaminase [Bacillus sp. FJAT-47783]|uniref:D-amino-acid transaminase n=1 Tax=Bacillus sp. FJAT-47783 TaxID=2922712 RepID=UPI001FADCA22
MAIGYINGKYVDLNTCVIPIDERGHQFGDGVYEVIRVYDGTPFMLKEHIERLVNSAHAIKLPITCDKKEYEQLIHEAIEKSALSNCDVYLQITRGIAPRNHLFPNTPVSTTMTVKPSKEIDSSLREKGANVMFHADERWAKCYIKSLNLLPNILAKQTAHENGYYEAILYRDEYVTEGTSSNVFIVKDGKIYTTPLTENILPGITRMAVKNIAEAFHIPFVEKRMTKDEVKGADEVFMTSTTAEVLPITSIEEHIIGTGKPGSLTTKFYREFQRMTGKEF